MHEQQRKFFEDPRRVLSLGVRRGRTQYGQEIKQAIEKQAEKRNEITEIVMDEAKEMSPQDFEHISEVLRDRMELQGGIQTAKSDWIAEFAREQAKDE